MAALPQDELHRLIWNCAEGSPPEVLSCIDEFGPFAGLVRLAPLFPHGYLDNSSGEAGHGRHAHREELGQLLLALNRRVPFRQRSLRGSIWDARLDDVVFREVERVCEGRRRDPSVRDLQGRLFAMYDVVPRLGRLTELVSGLRKEIDLSDAALVAHQHILGTVVSQLEGLWELGLEPSQTYVVGKAYSTNRLAAMSLEQKGCEVRSGLDAFSMDAILNPDYYHQANLEVLGAFFADVVKKIPTQGIGKLVVLDDGGLVLSWLDRAFESQWFSPEDAERLSRLKVMGVEQTTFGRKFIETSGGARRRPSEASIPVANVARTHLKLHKESDFIAESVVQELDAWIRANEVSDRRIRSLVEATVGVIGFGVVGSCVCKALRQMGVQKIVVFDEDISHHGIVTASGYRAAGSVGELAGECSVIVGCTGAPGGVELEAEMLTPGTVLASASSGNYEFARVFITSKEDTQHRERAHQKPNPDVTPGRRPSTFDWVHSIFSVAVPGGSAYVLNGGFPVNFTGAIDPIRAEQIELTRCLMVQGVASAYRRGGGRANFGGTVKLAAIDEEPLNEIFGF